MSSQTVRVSKWSPDGLTNTLDSWMNRLFEDWSQRVTGSKSRTRNFLILAFVVGAALLIYYSQILNSVVIGGGFSFNFLITRIPLFATLLMAGPLLAFLDKKWYPLCLFLFLLSYICGAWILGSVQSPLPVLTSTILTILLPGMLFALAFQGNFRLFLFPALTAVTIAAIFLVSLETPFLQLNNGKFHSIIKVAHLERILMVLGVLVAEYQVNILHAGLRVKELLQYLLSPSLLTYPLPVYSRHLNREHGSIGLMMEGFSDFSIAAIAIAAGIPIVHILTYLNRVTWLGEYPTLKLFVMGWFIYLFYYVNSFAHVRFGTGVLRWIGYKVPDGYHFPLFATTPQDRWRRWNTYFYAFFRSFVFLPVMKWTSSPFLASVITFFATFLFHQASMAIGLHSLNDVLGESLKLREDLIFFLLHGVAVWFGIRTARFWPSGESLWGWCGVILTHVMMAFIHSVFL